MNPLFFALIIVAAAAVAFFLAGYRVVGWLMLLGGALVAGAGVAAVHLIEKGPQSAFAHVPLSPTRIAWIGSIMALAGAGLVIGMLARTLRDAVKKPR